MRLARSLHVERRGRISFTFVLGDDVLEVLAQLACGSEEHGVE
ncbi:MAG TPA: hypothetical protein VNF71_12445 [Acidimicrobiales bacterium]|nr:hypothetical protein [Acidimicrobiales bacterium]